MPKKPLCPQVKNLLLTIELALGEEAVGLVEDLFGSWGQVLEVRVGP